MFHVIIFQADRHGFPQKNTAGADMVTKEKVEQILTAPALKAGLEKYQYIMGRFRKVDVSEDTEFQSVYRDFYQMRRFYSDEFARKYFRLMEQLKGMDGVTFKMAFERVKHIQCTYETSFSSKMAHTFNPQTPIWDKIVTTDHFGFRSPTGQKDREQKTVRRFEEYSWKFRGYMKSKEGQMFIGMFDKAFPDSGISDVKKIDFILWLDR